MAPYVCKKKEAKTESKEFIREPLKLGSVDVKRFQRGVIQCAKKEGEVGA